MSKIFVAMSGGVDSSVAAYLLKKAGHDVAGLHMHLWCEERQGKGAQRRQCCNADDVRDAERVCQHLGIPFYVMNFEREFKRRVVDYFCSEYARGRTPNPCMACNEYLKFGALFDRVEELGGEYLATGHYSRIDAAGDSRSGGLKLLRGIDPTKDQSYFLYMLGQKQLRRVLFPVGALTKREVRSIAGDAGLPVAGKADSVEVCFVADRNYRAFVAARATQTPGEVVDLRGNAVGSHQGLAGYTVGQRHGIATGGGVKLYVVRLDATGNRLIVGPETALYGAALVARDVRWVSGSAPSGELRCQAQIRYRSLAAPAIVLPEEDERLIVRFEEPQRAIAPGQSVVFYDGDEVLGGGIIDSVIGEAAIGEVASGRQWSVSTEDGAATP